MSRLFSYCVKLIRGIHRENISCSIYWDSLYVFVLLKRNIHTGRIETIKVNCFGNILFSCFFEIERSVLFKMSRIIILLLIVVAVSASKIICLIIILYIFFLTYNLYIFLIIYFVAIFIII